MVVGVGRRPGSDTDSFFNSAAEVQLIMQFIYFLHLVRTTNYINNKPARDSLPLLLQLFAGLALFRRPSLDWIQ